jgi:hypothetical protein
VASFAFSRLNADMIKSISQGSARWSDNLQIGQQTALVRIDHGFPHDGLHKRPETLVVTVTT